MKYKAVLFDLDGTLLDTSPGITQEVQATARHFGVPQLPDSQLPLLIGPPLHTSFHDLLGLRGDTLEQAVAYYRKRYFSQGQYQAAVYNGIVPLLELLRSAGALLAVATLKLESCAVSVLSHFALADFFQAICGSGSDHAHADKAEIVARCLKQLGNVPPGEAVLIGDSVYDAQGAQQAGVDFIAVSYGFGFVHQPQLLAAQEKRADTPEEIGRLLV